MPVFLGLVECAAGDRALLLRLNSLARSIEPTWAIGDLATCVGAVAVALAGTGETATAREAVRWAIEDVPEYDSALGWLAAVAGDALGRLAAVAGDLGLTDLLERLDARLHPTCRVLQASPRAGPERATPGGAWRRPTAWPPWARRRRTRKTPVGRAAAAVELLGHPMLITVRRALTAEMGGTAGR